MPTLRSQARLGQLVHELRDRAGEYNHVILEGYTDAQESNPAALSRKRAQVVEERLKIELPGLFYEIIPRGAEHPIAPNETPYGRQRNRRVQIYLAEDEAELTRLDLVGGARFLNPANYQREGDTFAGRLRFRQDLDLAETQRALSARLRYERMTDTDNRTAGVSRQRGERLFSLRLRSSPRRSLSLEWTGLVGRRYDGERMTGRSEVVRVVLVAGGE